MSTAIMDATGTVSRPLEEERTPALPAVAPQPVEPSKSVPAYVLPRTTNPLMKAALKGPILMWRLGLGRVFGRVVVVLTTTGRKSGQPRRTALGYSRLDGRKYVFSLRGPDTDWYRNLMADHHVTIQTIDGSEPALARRVVEDEEMWAAYKFLAPIPAMKQWARALDIELTREELVAHKDDFILIAFDPTTEPAPPPVKTDLVWVWAAVANIVATGLVVYTVARLARNRARAPRRK